MLEAELRALDPPAPLDPPEPGVAILTPLARETEEETPKLAVAARSEAVETAAGIVSFVKCKKESTTYRQWQRIELARKQFLARRWDLCRLRSCSRGQHSRSWHSGKDKCSLRTCSQSCLQCCSRC